MKLRYNLLLALAVSTMTLYAQNKKATKPKAAVTKAGNNGPAMTAKAKALYEDMLPNTQKIFIVDSTVVDNANLLDAIPLPEAYGKYVRYNDFFGTDSHSDTYVFVNGFGNRCYYTELGTDSLTRLYMRDRLGDGWGNAQPLKEINEQFADISMPYMSSDGQTLYFSAVSADEGLGKRDIYMTKYDADEGRFLQAENIGLPFNSAADDIAYIEADADHMAWFATSRRQPEGKVCVYAFVPTQPRQNYSEDEIPESRLRSLANLTRIRDTWPTPEIRDKALKHLEAMRTAVRQKAEGSDNMAFVVNDNTTYYSMDEFRSDETRKMYYDVIRLGNDLKAKKKQLEQLRANYHNAAAGQKEGLGRQIAALEQKTSQCRADLKATTDRLRQKECALLGR